MNTTPSSTPRISSMTTSDGIAVTRTPRHGNWPMPDQQVDATRPAGNSNKRALVLAGGGAAGNAWELGLIAGLSDAGVDVTEADLIIGRRQDRRWLPRSPAGQGRPNCLLPSSPRCLSHRLATPDRTRDALRISRGRPTWSGRTES